LQQDTFGPGRKWFSFDKFPLKLIKPLAGDTVCRSE
jgi:hypothetical protein